MLTVPSSLVAGAWCARGGYYNRRSNGCNMPLICICVCLSACWGLGRAGTSPLMSVPCILAAHGATTPAAGRASVTWTSYLLWLPTNTATQEITTIATYWMYTCMHRVSWDTFFDIYGLKLKFQVGKVESSAIKSTIEFIIKSQRSLSQVGCWVFALVYGLWV